MCRSCHRQVVAAVELAGVGNPLVDQDDGWGVLDKQFAQAVAGLVEVRSASATIS